MQKSDIKFDSDSLLVIFDFYRLIMKFQGISSTLFKSFLKQFLTIIKFDWCGEIDKFCDINLCQVIVNRRRKNRIAASI